MPVEPICLLAALGKVSLALLVPVLAGLSIDKLWLISMGLFGVGTIVGVIIALPCMYFTLENISVGLKKKFDDHPEFIG